jgi:hypothetical protein
MPVSSPGAAIFGVGWGLSGFCPGPAIGAVVSLRLEPFIFIAAMAIGMIGVNWYDRQGAGGRRGEIIGNRHGPPPGRKGFLPRADEHRELRRLRPGDHGACAVIDTVLDYDAAAGRTATASADEVIAYVREQGLTCEWVLETHVHADHLSAAPYVQEKLGGKLGIGSNITVVQDTFGKVFNAGTEFQRDGSQFDRLFQRRRRVRARLLQRPRHAHAGPHPGLPDLRHRRCRVRRRHLVHAGLRHRAGRLSRRLGAPALPLDPQGAGAAARDAAVPVPRLQGAGARRLCLGDDGGRGAPNNVHVRDGVGEDEFVAMREARDKTLSMPKLIIPSIQVNMRAGELPEPEDNGTVYLKVPINCSAQLASTAEPT